MIVIKDLRADALGEPLFEKVNLVIKPGERIGIVGSREGDVGTFLGILAGTIEMDAGTVTREGERVEYVSSEELRSDSNSLMTALHGRPTFIILDASAAGLSDTSLKEIQRFVAGFRGGILIASENEEIMQAPRITRMLEIQPATRTVTSYTGKYGDYVIEREKNRARATDAYEKQQKEKRRLEDWLTQKRKEAANDRSPEKGATIRTKAKYLQREILDKEIPKPIQPE